MGLEALGGWRAVLAFSACAVFPTASYAAATIFVASLASSSSSAPALLFSFLVFSLLLFAYFSHHLKDRFFASVPAYAPIVGHFVTAFVTFSVKLRPVVDACLDAIFVVSCIILTCLFSRVVSSDPGFTSPRSSGKEGSVFGEEQVHHENEGSIWRGKYCRFCQALIERYDHHCAGVRNCIGRKNHLLFLFLLLAFIGTEALYLSCCTSYMKAWLSQKQEKREFVSNVSSKICFSPDDGDCSFSFDDLLMVVWKALCSEPLVLSTGAFVALQMLWQTPFLIFQLYLVAHNLTMDEWVHWEEYPSFYKEVTASFGDGHHQKKFFNPYNGGLVNNMYAMLQKWSRYEED